MLRSCVACGARSNIMALPLFVKSLEDVPEGVREYYTETKSDDGVTEFTLDTDERPKVREFRTSNINLQKTNASLSERLKAQEAELQKVREQYNGIDPERYKRAMGALEKIEADDERKLIEEGNINEVVQRRMKSAIQSHEERAAALQQARDEAARERDQYRQQVHRATLHSEVQRAVEKTGVRLRQTALPDLISRVEQTFTVDEHGTPVARRGDEQLFGAKGEPLSLEEHVSTLAAKSAPHLFEGAGGAGSEGGRRAVTPAGKRIIDRNDPIAVGRALDDLSSGKAQLSSE